jgi:recombination protein U
MGSKGNDLEKRANRQNILYRKDDRALILKVEVPIIITGKGLVAKQSTVDYTGVLKGGKAIAFDAKETQNKTSFPLSNIKDHQLAYLGFHQKLGGIAFFMIHFKKVYENKVYITPVSLIEKYKFGNERKSIPFKDFKKEWLVEIENYLDKVNEMEKELT